MPQSATIQSNKPLPKERFAWLDLLRGVATVLVLVLHSTLIGELHGITPDFTLVHINKLFSPFRMPLLMFVSGFLLQAALRKSTETYLVRKVATLLYPYVLWTLIYGVIDPGKSLTSPYLWIGASYLWFIGFLFTYFIIALLTVRIPAGAIVIIAAIISFISPDHTKYMERYFFLMSFFFLGYWMAINRRAFERLTSARALLIAGPLALALAIFAVRSGDIRYEVEYYPAVFAAILVLIGGARQLDRSCLANMLIFVGRNSVVFFVAHYPLIYVWIGLLLWLGVHSILLITASSFVLASGVCTLLAYVRERRGTMDYLYVMPEPLQALTRWAILPALRRV